MATTAETAAGASKLNEQVDLSTIPISPDGDNEKPEASDDIKTVFHDKENFNVKHPLQNKWTLWFTKPPSGKVCAPEASIGPLRPQC
jgi:translation initiation factor 4E